MRNLTMAEAILEASDQLLAADESVYLMGLGVPDPKGIFGTTIGLAEKYGADRVQDMPISENAITGIGVGSAIVGMRPIMTHQRVDFFLLAMDQLVNNAAKWNYMFGDQMKVPIVFRLVMGRGWGQGPQHSQSLHSIFAHIPGLKVVMPSNPKDAKGLLISATEDNHPVVFLEHRWLHGIHGEVPQEMYRTPIGKANILQEGSELTIVACSHMTLEAFRALKMIDASVELIDLRTVKPFDKETILNSVKKTGRLLVADPDWKSCGFGAEVLATVTEEAFGDLKMAPRRVCFPDRHSPTSWALSNLYYPTAKEIAIAALDMLGRKTDSRDLLKSLLDTKMAVPLDQPDKSFTGPF